MYAAMDALCENARDSPVVLWKSFNTRVGVRVSTERVSMTPAEQLVSARSLKVSKQAKSAKCVRPVILHNTNDLPICKIRCCNRKATFSEGSVPTHCSTHRTRSHVCLFSRISWPHLCFCGSKATYRTEGSLPSCCYVHKQPGMITVHPHFERFVVHHHGRFVASYIQPVEGPQEDQTAPRA